MAVYSDSQNGLGRFKCNKSGCKRGGCVAKGTLFEGAHLMPDVVARLMYGFAHDWSYEQIRAECQDLDMPIAQRTELSSETISFWLVTL